MFLEKYPQAKLLFTDTDSLYYHIETPDLEKELADDKTGLKGWLDYSDYTGPYHDDSNKKLIGKFKCETKGAPIIELIGLRPKMYSYLYKESEAPEAPTKEKHRVKGISRAAARSLKHEEYRKQLEAPTENYVTTRRFGSKLHQIYSIANEKRALCAYDDKRFILADNHHTLAYGHKDIPVTLEVDDIQNVGRETIMTEDQAREVHFPMGRPPSEHDQPLCMRMHPDSTQYPKAREMGVLWTKRTQAKKHVESITDKIQEEATEEEEIQAGR